METTTTTSKIFELLARAQAEIRPAVKDSFNPHYKSRYASLASTIDSVREVFGKHGLSIVQRVSGSIDVVEVETTIYCADGSSICGGKVSVPNAKKDAQGYGSALTYARRYSLSSVVCLATDDDDDGNAAAATTENRSSTSQLKATVEKISDEQIEKIIALAGEKLAGDESRLKKALDRHYRKSSVDDLTATEAIDCINRLQKIEVLL